MISVSIGKCNGYINGFIVEGHSSYAEHGKDIICSAISALSQTLFLTLKEIYGPCCSYDKQNGYLEVIILNGSLKEVQLLFRSFIIGVNAISEQYPEYVKVSN